MPHRKEWRDWNDFFDPLNICLSRKHQNDIVVIGCDTKSSMGTRNSTEPPETTRMDSIGTHAINHINEAGRRCRSYLEMNNLVALTTFFRKKNHGTWMHPRSKSLHQIDHFLTTKDSFSRFCDAGITAPLLDSDHCAIRCRLRVLSRLQRLTQSKDAPSRSLQPEHQWRTISILQGCTCRAEYKFCWTAIYQIGISSY